MVGFGSFIPGPTKTQYFQIGKKTRVKMKAMFWTKLPNLKLRLFKAFLYFSSLLLYLFFWSSSMLSYRFLFCFVFFLITFSFVLILSSVFLFFSFVLILSFLNNLGFFFFFCYKSFGSWTYPFLKKKKNEEPFIHNSIYLVIYLFLFNRDMIVNLYKLYCLSYISSQSNEIFFIILFFHLPPKYHENTCIFHPHFSIIPTKLTNKLVSM